MSHRYELERKFTKLHQSGQRFTEADTLKEVYVVVLETVGSVMGFDFAVVIVAEEDRLRYVKTRGSPSRKTG
jgi:hypothetical protein